MILLDAPGWGRRQIEHVVLDFNGTLACDGRLLAEAEEWLARLTVKARVHLCSADHFGTVADETRRFDLGLKVLKGSNHAEEKMEFVRRLGPLQVAAMGNGSADAKMLREAALGICVIGPEGACTQALAAADVACRSIVEALQLLLKPDRLAATLRR